MNKRFTFTLELVGFGQTVDEAWDCAVEAFTDDPGSVPEQHTVETLEDTQ